MHPFTLEYHWHTDFVDTTQGIHNLSDIIITWEVDPHGLETGSYFLYQYGKWTDVATGEVIGEFSDTIPGGTTQRLDNGDFIGISAELDTVDICRILNCQEIEYTYGSPQIPEITLTPGWN